MSKLLEQKIKELDKNYTLYYVDYRDNLDDHEDIIEEMVSKPNGLDYLSEKVFDWYYMQGDSDSMDYILKELLTEEEQEELESTGELQELIDEIRNRDDSTIEEDLLKNTSDRYFYYDLDYYVEDEEDLKKFCEKFGIDYDNALKIYRESFGYGQAVILFWDSVSNVLEEGNTIVFDKNCKLGFISRSAGSGWSGELGQELALPFIRENLHDDKGDPGYSFTGDVCGMVGGAMGGVVIKNTEEKLPEITINEAQKAFREREEMYEKNWKAGKCTFGDMNYKRHKNTPYRNEYPCGNKCTECGTFWID